MKMSVLLLTLTFSSVLFAQNGARRDAVQANHNERVDARQENRPNSPYTEQRDAMQDRHNDRVDNRQDRRQSRPRRR